jgi:transposase
VELPPCRETELSKKTLVASERDRPDIAHKRAQWKKYQGRIKPERLAFIDETWTKTNMAPLRGWAPRGMRLTTKVPHGRWKTTTFLAALRNGRIDAPWVLDGPIDGETFRIYVEKVLVPTLKPGDIVIMDNLGSHKGKAVRQLIRAAGAKLFLLPKYSPDLNPIEQVFAKLKHLLRKRAARTVEAVSAAAGLRVILIRTSVERARSIQEVNDHDSIVARQRHAAEFFNSIAQGMPLCGHAGCRCAVRPSSGLRKG